MTAAAGSSPISLRLSITDRCQLRCFYCMPPEGVEILRHQDILTFEEIVRFVRVARRHFGLAKVRLTGGEPLLRPGVVELVKMLAAESLDDLAMTTNAQKLAELAGSLKAAGLQRLNISLDTLDPERYRSLTRGGHLARVLEGLVAALQVGFAPVKINTVVLRGINDSEVVDIARFGLSRGITVRFLELMPIGSAREAFHRFFVPAREVRTRIEEVFRLEPHLRRTGESSRNFLAADEHGLRGTLGFIESESAPFCEGCTRLRLTSTGRIVPCLSQPPGPSLREFLRDESPENAEAVRKIIADQLCQKKRQPDFEAAGPMPTVGG